MVMDFDLAFLLIAFALVLSLGIVLITRPL